MHDTIAVETCSGQAPGIAPLVISASRATDIPAFHAEWFMRRLERGYCAWINPFNRKQKSFVSFEKCRVIVFWSKNPQPLIPYLDAISESGKHYYFHYTLNDYEKEGFEHVPPLGARIETFMRLSEKIGAEKVIWRYDPIIRTDSLDPGEILRRIERIGESISPYTTKLVFSFVDMLSYANVTRKLRTHSMSAREPDSDERLAFATELIRINAAWKNPLALATCAEPGDFPGIGHNRCIDPALICTLCPDLGRHYGTPRKQLSFDGKSDEQGSGAPKDAGQRKACGCAPSKDIGAYNTCRHVCAYCYANHSETAVRSNCAELSKKRDNESLFV